MIAPPTSGSVIASRMTYLGAALFIALIVLFSIQATAPAPILVFALVAAGAHLVLFPAVAVLPAPAWSRAAGYAWLSFDVILNIASLNGAPMDVVMPLRLGGHILAGVWIGFASRELAGTVRVTGIVLGALLILHAFLAPWLPQWAIFPPFVLIPLWLSLVARALSRSTQATPAAVA